MMTITCPNGHSQIIVNEEDLRDDIRCPECGIEFNIKDPAAGHSMENDY